MDNVIERTVTISDIDITAPVSVKGGESSQGVKVLDGREMYKGDKGDPGESAYELAVANGFGGTEEEWLESLHGRDGKDGVVGRDGVDGYTPVKGVDYFDGKDGYTPIKGVDYFDGEDGYTPQKGVDYFDGKDGRDGSDGAPGRDGHTPVKGVDYFDGKDGAAGPQGPAGYTPQKGIDYFDGKDGKDGYTPVKGVDYFDGQDGKDGYTPVKGKDYFDGSDGKDGIDGKTPVKGVDYFDGKNGSDGKDGTSPTVSVTAITGGHRISITDANGTKIVDVMDGLDGAAGSPGKDGSNGSDGKDGNDGVGIASIKQTTTSTADDGNNIITVTLTNGQTATFTVQNGSKGSAGKDGVDGKDGSDANVTATNIKSALGYDPAKQTDVESLSEEIVAQQTAIEELQEALRVNPILGSIDENNNIILVGTLADGEYTLKYENGDEYIDIGTLVVGEGEPITPPDTTIVWEKGTKIDSSTGAETTGQNVYSASNYFEIVEGFTYRLTKTANAATTDGMKVCYYDVNKSFISTSSDVISQGTGATTVTIPLIDNASYFRLRAYSVVSQLTDDDYTLTAEVSA